MKKLVVSLSLLFFVHKANACVDVNLDYEYFNLFAQEMIHSPEYEPFLLAYDMPFYETRTKFQSENIESWQKYFDNKLSYDETLALVQTISLKHLQDWSHGKLTHVLSKKLGAQFFNKYKQGLTYLIKAKELEPYMAINFVADEDSFYFDVDENRKNATQLNYSKTMESLMNAYKTSTNKEIKLRYAYQIVRFNHYTRNYQKAVHYFETLVTPLNLKSPIYYYALQQMAGAQNGLGKKETANWNFFKVFIHSRDLKQSSYTSMKFSNSGDFEGLLSKAKTAEEKNMAYFLLAYNGYSNPVPLMQKMLKNNANSKILKVLAARAINELERSYLMAYPSCKDKDKCQNKLLPVRTESYYTESTDFSEDLRKIITEIKATSKDVFWELSDAYLRFLNKDFNGSNLVLNKIKTTNSDYIQQIEKMKMLNEIVSQTKITPAFEEILMKKYGKILREEPSKDEISWYNSLSTRDFIIDIIANRYFVEQQDAKSFLLNNSIHALQYYPNLALTKKIEAFYKKPNKTSFEKFIIEQSIKNINAEAFFELIYGDHAMRMADFKKAKTHYEKAGSFEDIYINNVYYYGDDKEKAKADFKDKYDGYNHISSLVFGHNVWESFDSPQEVSMKAEDLSLFPFIKQKMNKLELAQALIQLEEIGKEKSVKGVKANQLIGNLLYNTSVLGYFRELFTLDMNNGNSPKFHFHEQASERKYDFSYKTFYDSGFIEPDNFDLAIGYYEKALKHSKNKEQKARILFQMASAEQGKFYQWEANQSFYSDYSDSDYSEKRKVFEAQMNLTKREKFRTYFAELKKHYKRTQTVKDLQTSCLYFAHYMR